MPESRRLALALLALICAVYLLLAWRYAVETPDWQVPDEPAHYNYIRQLSEEGQLPEIVPGDWDTDYQDLLRNTGFDPQHLGQLERVEYEDHQPPLYYLLATPVYALTDGDLLALRLFSVLLGLGVVVAACLTVWRLFPAQPWLGLGTAAFIAFLPQNLTFLSGVNNDPLAQFMVAMTLLAVVEYLRREQVTPRFALLLGGLVGLAFITKSTVYFLAGIAGLAILLRFRRERWSRGVFLQHVAAYLLPALLLGGLWWGRNLSVYGGTDFLGLQRHDEVAAGQLQTDDYINRDLGGDTSQYRRNFAYTTFHSFWGQFGWMAVPMPTNIYRGLLLLTLIALADSVLYAALERWPKSLHAYQRESLALFVLAIVLVGAAYLLYNRQFVQFQGRYLFPALLPLGLWFTLGLSGTLRALRWPPLRWLVVPAMFLLAIFAYYALRTYLVPNLPNWE